MSPIAVFAFNRKESLAMTIDALRANPEARESDLYVFVDGARDAYPEDAEAVEAVRKYAATITGFKSVICKFADHNQGLGPAIISGVSEVIGRHGTVIVVEDDLSVEPGFLKFINAGLHAYEHSDEVWSVCGYSNKVYIPKDYPYDAYFSTRSSSWGWATWADRWNSVDWTFRRWEEWKGLARKFNRWGGSDCFGMLAACRQGENRSWAIRFCFNQFLQDKLSLFPIKSLVVNNGFDGSGTNCRRWSRFKYDVMPSKDSFRLPPAAGIAIDRHIHKSALAYHSIPIRIVSRIMYALT